MSEENGQISLSSQEVYGTSISYNNNTLKKKKHYLQTGKRPFLPPDLQVSLLFLADRSGTLVLFTHTPKGLMFFLFLADKLIRLKHN